MAGTDPVSLMLRPGNFNVCVMRDRRVNGMLRRDVNVACMHLCVCVFVSLIKSRLEVTFRLYPANTAVTGAH